MASPNGSPDSTVPLFFSFYRICIYSLKQNVIGHCISIHKLCKSQDLGRFGISISVLQKQATPGIPCQIVSTCVHTSKIGKINYTWMTFSLR